MNEIMRITKALLCLAVFWCTTTTAVASMVWSGVAVDPALEPRLRSDNAFLEATLDASRPDASVYLDKAWHGIHFLLTGSADSTDTLASKVIFGGESIGPDQGYGPAQLLTPQEVKAIAELLGRETPERLASRYDPKAFEKADIYPSGIWVREGRDALKYELAYYVQLVKPTARRRRLRAVRLRLLSFVR